MPATLCICDDDPVVGELLTLDLRAAGFDVPPPMTSIEEAVGLLSIEPPDVLLLDLDMPSGGGLALLGHLRAQGVLHRTRVLMLTGEDDVHFMSRARSLGATGYITKPVESGRLVAAVRRVLDDRVSWIDDLVTVVAPEAPPVAAPREAPVRDLRRRILSVEDVACNQELVALFLDAATHVVDRVRTGAEALAAVKARRYDLVLLDLRLPDMDGLDVARRIRAGEAGGARLPIVAVTADVRPERVAAAQAAGVDAHVAKPFTSASLSAAVAARFEAPAPAPALDNLTPTLADLAQTYGQPVVERLLRSLMAQLERLDGLAEAAELEHAAHAIKGAASSLGFVTVSDACSELEAACKTGEVVQLPLTRATTACASARAAIADRLRRAA